MYILDQAKAAGLKGTDMFSAENQDKMAISLIVDKRKITPEMIKNNPNEAMIRLGMEWAAFPMPVDMQGHKQFVKAGQSYYAGDGRNASGATVDEMRAAAKLGPTSTVTTITTSMTQGEVPGHHYQEEKIKIKVNLFHHLHSINTHWLRLHHQPISIKVSTNISQQLPYEETGSTVVMVQGSNGQQMPMISGGKGTPIIMGSGDVVNSYYKSQVLGSLYKQG